MTIAWPLAAQTVSTAPWQFSEVRLGAVAHDVGFLYGREGGADLNAEWTSSSLLPASSFAAAPGWAQWLLHPRAHAGILVNLNGRTSQAYAGLTWTTALAAGLLRPADAIEFSFLFGGAVNDGDHAAISQDRKSLGSNILFHLGAEIAYRIDARWSVGLFFDHSSNGGIARDNEGLNNLGGRVAYRF